MDDTQYETITGADLLNRYPKGVRMIQIAYKQVSGASFDRNGVVAPEVLAQLDAKYLPGASKAPAQKRRAKVRTFRQVEAAQHVTFSRNIAQETAPVVAPVAQPEITQEQMPEQDAQVSRNWRDRLSDAICICIVVFHAGLIAYDCAQMWGTPGKIGGGIAFLVQCLALLYATDPNKVRTSERALYVCFAIDVLAVFVHYPTFTDSASYMANKVTTCVFSIVICAFSFTALSLYRDSKIISYE